MAREVLYKAPCLLDAPKRVWLFCAHCHNPNGPEEVSELTIFVETENGNLLFLAADAMQFVSDDRYEYARS